MEWGGDDDNNGEPEHCGYQVSDPKLFLVIVTRWVLPNHKSLDGVPVAFALCLQEIFLGICEGRTDGF